MSHPNILFVFADQMRASALGCLGIENVRTPHLDALAEEGTLFSRAVSNHPICCPARATILTGLHSQTHGLVTNDMQLRTDVRCVAHHLGDLGYGCGYVGKVHFDIPDRGAFIPPGSRRRGFDDLWAINNCNHHYLQGYYYLDDDPEPVWIEGYEPEAQTDIAVSYIRRKSAEDAPFCLFISYGTPHCPYRMAPESVLAEYPPEGIQPKPNASPAAKPEVIAGYYAHVTALDAQVGRLLRALEEQGLRGNTLVVFTSDHGDMLFSHDRGWKMKPWAESVGIPFIARWPGRVPAGRRCGAPIGLVDVMPTLLGLAGAPVPEGLDGLDLSRLFLGDESAAPESQLIYNPIVYANMSFREWRGVVTRTHSYARTRDAAWILHDDTADPHQLYNLADDPEHRGLQSAMEVALQRHLDAVGDAFPASEGMSRQYVDNKVVTSEDREEVLEYLEREYAGYLRFASPPEAARRDPAEIGRVPNAAHYVGYFDNVRILRGRRGEGRQRFHHDLFPEAREA